MVIRHKKRDEAINKRLLASVPSVFIRITITSMPLATIYAGIL
ncbi:MAG: hypothetical protein ACTSR8_14645 [Promethearchaeota archaeon]